MAKLFDEQIAHVKEQEEGADKLFFEIDLLATILTSWVGVAAAGIKAAKSVGSQVAKASYEVLIKVIEVNTDPLLELGKEGVMKKFVHENDPNAGVYTKVINMAFAAPKLAMDLSASHSIGDKLSTVGEYGAAVVDWDKPSFWVKLYSSKINRQDPELFKHLIATMSMQKQQFLDKNKVKILENDRAIKDLESVINRSQSPVTFKRHS